MQSRPALTAAFADPARATAELHYGAQRPDGLAQRDTALITHIAILIRDVDTADVTVRAQVLRTELTGTLIQRHDFDAHLAQQRAPPRRRERLEQRNVKQHASLLARAADHHGTETGEKT